MLRSIEPAISDRNKTEKGNTHCNPTKLNVKSAILVDSFRPWMEGVPAHLAACGILIIHVLSCTQFSRARAHEPNPKIEGGWCGGLSSNRIKTKTPVEKRRAIQNRNNKVYDLGRSGMRSGDLGKGRKGA